MKFKYKNGYICVDNESIGRGANYVTYRGTLYDDNFDGKKVILKVFEPIGFATEYVYNDNCITAIKILPAQTSNSASFLKKYISMERSIRNLARLQRMPALRKHIVDIYGFDNCLFDINNNSITIDYAESDCKSIGSYKAFSIYFDDDFDNGIEYENYHHFKFDAIEDIIDVVIKMAEIIRVLHRKNLIHRDIKPSNFLYNIDRVDNSKQFNIKMLDTDTITKLASGKFSKISSSEPFAPSEAYDGLYDKSTDVYMLVTTLISLLFSSSEIYMLCETEKNFKIYNYNNIITDDSCEFLKEKYNCSQGFINKLSDIISYSLSDSFYRCSSVDRLIRDLSILREIHENKGIHPEVIRDNAEKIIKDFNLDIDEDLFADVSVSEE